MSEAAERWARALSSWRIPQEMLDSAEQSPWVLPREVFCRRADARIATPRGATFERAVAAVGEGATVLDVGCAAGATSLPLVSRAPVHEVVGLDGDEELLTEFAARATTLGVPHRTVRSSWPAVEPVVADVTVCGNVVYNVADIEPFVAALTEATRRTVIVESAAVHPLTELNWLWREFHGVDRPTGPSAEDFLAVLGELGVEFEVASVTLPAEAEYASFADLVDVTRRRLCLPVQRTGDVAEALRARGIDEAAPPDLGSSGRSLVTVSWAGSAG